MYIVGIIPARGGSKGLPGKNIKPINGKPMIGYVIEAARAAEKLDRVIVSTDADDIAAVAREFGAEVVRRPEDISGDTAAIEDSLRHVVRHLEAQEGVKTDVAVLMQTNVPVRKPGAIDEIIEKLVNSEYDSVVSAFRVNQRPEWMKRADENGALVPFMECGDYRRQLLPDLYLLDGAVMAVRASVLFATEGRTGVHVYLGRNVGFVEYDRIYSLDVDTPEDYEIVEHAMNDLSAH